MPNEFLQFITVMRNLGIEVNIEYNLSKEKWQNIINKGKYNITSLSCSGLHIGATVYIFAHGKANWNDLQKNGEGKDSGFLMAYDTNKKEIIHRKCIRKCDGKVDQDLIGCDAMMMQLAMEGN